MHTGTLRKWALALTFWLALHAATLRAQIVFSSTPSVTSSDTIIQAYTTVTHGVDFEFRSDGILIAKGGTGSLLSTDQGMGTRMLWYPQADAFRAGSVGGTEWDQSNIGLASAAFGEFTKASGLGSFACGVSSTASGLGSFAGGESSLASNVESVALGGGHATGPSSIAIGSSTASGQFSAAFGWSSASGAYATASGYYCIASGYASTAIGNKTTASAYASLAIGSFNVGLSSTGAPPSATSWVPIDPIFEVGNGNWGTASNNYTPTYSDALVVYKNGNAIFQGSVTVAPGGDIPMYTGN